MKGFLKSKLIIAFVMATVLVSAIVVLIPTDVHAHAATQETLTVPFVNGINGATTINSYTGFVNIIVSGYGQASATQCSDAFYIFTDNSNVQGTCGNPITPYHDGFGLCINSQQVDNSVATPLYRSDHTYQFTISMGSNPQQITFGACDLFTSDNTGSFTVTVKTTPTFNLSLPSDKWAGYVSHSSSLNTIQYTRADGSWTVPSEPCSSTTSPNRLDIWDGLGGTNQAPLEQTGVALICNNTPNAGLQIRAWYELLGRVDKHPHFMTTPTAILPGDIIKATTQYLGSVSSTNMCNSDPNLGSPGGTGVYQFSITDSTKGWQVVSDRLCGDGSSAARSSTDWIVEGHGTLLDFDRVDFSSCLSSNGVISAGPVIYKISMYLHLNSHSQLKAFPSSLSPDGTVFTVYWNHS